MEAILKRNDIVYERNILISCRLAIRAIIEKANSSVIEEDSEQLLNFIAILERVLSHKLKGFKTWYGSEPCEYWNFIKYACRSVPNNCLNGVDTMEGLKKAFAKGRVWLQMALIEKRLAEYLDIAFRDMIVLRKFYEVGAICRSGEMKTLMEDMKGLDVIDFNFCMKLENPLWSAPFRIDFSPYLKFYPSDGEVSNEAGESSTPNGHTLPWHPLEVEVEESWEGKFHLLSRQYKTTHDQKIYLEELNKKKDKQLEEDRKVALKLSEELSFLAVRHQAEKTQVDGLIMQLQQDLSLLNERTQEAALMAVTAVAAGRGVPVSEYLPTQARNDFIDRRYASPDSAISQSDAQLSGAPHSTSSLTQLDLHSIGLAASKLYWHPLAPVTDGPRLSLPTVSADAVQEDDTLNSFSSIFSPSPWRQGSFSADKRDSRGFSESDPVGVDTHGDRDSLASTLPLAGSLVNCDVTQTSDDDDRSTSPLSSKDVPDDRAAENTPQPGNLSLLSSLQGRSTSSQLVFINSLDSEDEGEGSHTLAVNGVREKGGELPSSSATASIEVNGGKQLKMKCNETPEHGASVVDSPSSAGSFEQFLKTLDESTTIELHDIPDTSKIETPVDPDQSKQEAIEDFHGAVEHVHGAAVHVQRVAEHVQGAAEHVQGVVEYIQGTVEDVQGDVKDAQGAVEDIQGDIEGVREAVEHVQGAAEYAQGAGENAQGAAEHVQGAAEHVQGGVEHVQTPAEQGANGD